MLAVAALTLLAGASLAGGDQRSDASQDTEATGLAGALASHPWASEADELAARTHAPLPATVDRGLGQLVNAHERALATGSDEPLAEATQQARGPLATGADQLAGQQTSPELPEGQPVQARDSLTDSLLDLYAAIGLGEVTLSQLEPRVEASASQLPSEDRARLAQLVTAQASHQVHALELARAMADGTVDAETLEATQTSLADLHATVDALGDPVPAEQREDPWTDPLGLIVLGTPGPDRFDGDLDGDAKADQVRENEATLRASLTQTVDRRQAIQALDAGASATATDDGDPRTRGGWHMTVLDPGGDDTYADNAAGITAGTTIEVHADAQGPVETVRQPLVDDGHVCPPDTASCEPFSAGTFLQALGHVALRVDADPSLAAPLNAIVLDAAGDDTYTPREGPVQAAAQGPAASILHDAAGDDTYEADAFAQGAASAYGHAALVDRAGEDTYHAGQRSQGHAQLPDLTVHPGELGPFEGDDLGLRLIQHARAVLVDQAGTDTYAVDDPSTTQGVTQLDGDVAHELRRWVPAALVDAGGQGTLPVPERPDGDPVDPTQVTVDGSTQAQAWVKRALHAEDATPPPDEDRRYKTAIHVDDTQPALVEAYGLRFAGAELDCQADLGPRQAVCLLVDGASAPSVLVGSPDEIHDPPALTIALTGHTTYEGSIAASTGTPHLLVDLLGDDRYEADRASVGYAEHGGTALLVDARGQDEVTAGDRSLAHARGPESTAIVQDLDGRLDARTGEQSQAFARQTSSNPYLQAVDTREVEDAPRRVPVAMLDLGHGDEQGPAHLEAGNRSQAFSRGLGVAVLNGTTSDDVYETHGWGQGVHEDQQVLKRFCQGPTTERPLSDALTRGLTPWAGGTGAMLDPAGDDTYTIHGDAGQGDAAMASPHCGESSFSNALRGPVHASQPGLGLLHDDEGEDRYEQTTDPPRPDKLPDRACNTEGPCRPADDTTWVAVDEVPVTDITAFGAVRTVGTVGLGIDGTGNAADAPLTACQAFDTYHDDRRWFLGDSVEKTLSLNCEHIIAQVADELPTGRPALDTSLPTDDPSSLAIDPDLRGDHR